MRSIVFCLTLASITGSIVAQSNLVPLDDIVARSTLEEKPILSYPPVREADLLWEKRIWRVIDTREKMNKTFQYPVAPFFEILHKAITDGELTAYSGENDRFTIPLESKELNEQILRCDTFEIVDPKDYEVTYQILCSEIDPEDIVRYRIKEVWYFDTRTSTMKARILGIAPIRDEYDEQGNFKYETPLFWIYYPHAREVLARHKVFNPQNDSALMSWEDIFEMRFFSSYIYKESNVRDERLEDYLSGVDRLLESQKLEAQIFNFEHDLWSY